jgi:hypothetical protein
MSANIQDDLKHIKADLLDGMRDYMNDLDAEADDSGYTELDIAKCENLIDGFLAKVSSATVGDSDLVMSAVKETVLALNDLNASCGGSLIETDQRESICELIIRAAAAAGVGSGNEDITEDWREW